MGKLPPFIKPQDIEATIERWMLPEVNSQQQSIGLQQKKTGQNVPEPAVSVIEEEVQVEKITLAELEAIRENAYEEGFESGRQEGLTAGREAGEQQGYQEGLAKAEAESAPQQALLAELITALESPLAQQQDDIAQWLVSLSSAVAQAVIGQACTLDKCLIEDALVQALEQLPAGEADICVRVHPDEIGLATDLLSHKLAAGSWTMQPDPELSPGGCCISTANSRVDYSLEYRLNVVADELQRRLAASLNQQPAPDHDNP